MNISNNQERNNLITQLIATVNEYYDYSFRVHNERCFVIIFKLIEQLEALLGIIEDTDHQMVLRDVLNQVANAMASKDYVLIRDLLHYELRNKLCGMKK